MNWVAPEYNAKEHGVGTGLLYTFFFFFFSSLFYDTASYFASFQFACDVGLWFSSDSAARHLREKERELFYSIYLPVPKIPMQNARVCGIMFLQFFNRHTQDCSPVQAAAWVARGRGKRYSERERG